MPSFDIPAVYMYLKKFRCVDDSCQIVGITLLVQGTTFVKWTGKHMHHKKFNRKRKLTAGAAI